MLSDVTRKGIEAQIKVELRANELGYIVSKPTTECCRYDLILDDGDKLKRVQVKYCGQAAKGVDGSVHLDLRKFSSNEKVRPYYTKNEIDALIVYVAPIDRLCYIPIEVVAKKSTINLRYMNPKNGQWAGVTLCDDYLW